LVSTRSHPLAGQITGSDTPIPARRNNREKGRNNVGGIMKQISSAYEVIAYYTPLALWTGAILMVVLKRKILSYFQKSLIQTQEALKRELEILKAEHTRDLERYKTDIDVQRSLALEMSQRKLAVYSELSAYLYEFHSFLFQYNKLGYSAQRQEFLSSAKPKILLVDSEMSKNLFFLAHSVREAWLDGMETMEKIEQKLKKSENIDGNLVNEFIAATKRLNGAMLEDVRGESKG
jgi:hypothetical protein